MKRYSWGSHPEIKCSEHELKNSLTLKSIIANNNELIAHGNGRSYGDSSINENIINCVSYNSLLSFDEKNGIIIAQAGMLFSDILKIIVPKGWFLKVTPGTKFITLGGAIASDIHGKNHHIDGCFSESIISFSLMLPNGEIVECKKSDELFLATCGGMGLTGVIIDAKISLMKIISKNIDTTSIKTNNLKETFKIFESNNSSKYSVAWIDSSAKELHAGRGIVTIGDFSSDGDLSYRHVKNKASIPRWTPSFLMNRFTIKVFNLLYYRLQFRKFKNLKMNLNEFFYPLDKLANWNNLYGRNGFIQYQFILPKDQSYDGMKEILELISFEKMDSFLAVLKLYGPENNNYLSFPLMGYSLAIDFKITKKIYAFLEKLDAMVLKYKGRVYLSKDVRISKEIFQKNYPKVNEFRELRDKYKMNEKFHSLQSKRVGI
jgi:decaprenylphospho-beta-D-ribofuranose 2-oxidase